MIFVSFEAWFRNDSFFLIRFCFEVFQNLSFFLNKSLHKPLKKCLFCLVVRRTFCRDLFSSHLLEVSQGDWMPTYGKWFSRAASVSPHKSWGCSWRCGPWSPLALQLDGLVKPGLSPAVTSLRKHFSEMPFSKTLLSHCLHFYCGQLCKLNPFVWSAESH